MKARFLLLMAGFLLTGCGGGGPSALPRDQATLVVVVSAQDGSVVPGVDVSLEPSGRSQRTDDHGIARFIALAAGPYVITIEAGSSRVQQSVDLQPPSAEVRVTLEAALLRIDGPLDVDWGAPESLRATLGAGIAGEVVWASLRDRHLGQPVELGRGASVSIAPLRPGENPVEVRLIRPGLPVATARATVRVRYRESWNVDLVGRVPYQDGTVGDVWVTERHALVARRAAGGISIVDLDRIAEVGRFTQADMFTQDVHAVGTRAFVADEGSHPNSTTIIDISDPGSPRELGGIPDAVTLTAHTVWGEGTTLYLASPPTRQIHVWDVADPTAPRRLSTIASSASGVAHDMYVREGLLFGAYMALAGGTAAIVVASVEDPANPVVRANVSYPGAVLTHSTWTTADGRYLYVADEVVNAPIRIFDVQVPSNPLLVGTYQPRLGTVPHHLLVQDARFAYIADYKNGIEILDITDPVRPRLVGFYDTHPGIASDGDAVTGSANLFQGAWGVHWTDDGRIVVSDMNRGLFILRYRG